LLEASIHHNDQFNIAFSGGNGANGQFSELIKSIDTMKSDFTQKCWDRIPQECRGEDCVVAAKLFYEYYTYMRRNITDAEYSGINNLKGQRKGLKWYIMLGSYADALLRVMADSCSHIDEGKRYDVRCSDYYKKISWLLHEIKTTLQCDQERGAAKNLLRYNDWIKKQTNYFDVKEMCVQ